MNCFFYRLRHWWQRHIWNRMNPQFRQLVEHDEHDPYHDLWRNKP